MTARDQEEQDLRIDQMTINIEKLRADMRWESRKFAVSTVLAAAALVAAGAAAGNYFARQPPPPIVIQLPAPAK